MLRGRTNEECAGCLETKPLLLPVELFTIGGPHFEWLCFDCRVSYEQDEWCCLMSDISHRDTPLQQQEILK